MLDFEHARETMVRGQVEGRGIRNAAVLDALRAVPREAFVPKGLRDFAYEDTALPIEAGQTISQPYIVALMAEAAEITPGDRVLEVGAGSGYAAAVLSRLARQVYTIERHDALSRLAAARLRRLGYDNVQVRTGDGAHGWSEAAPFDAILVAAAGPAVPQALKDQLDIGGRLVMPVGEEGAEQRLVKIVRTGGTHDLVVLNGARVDGWAADAVAAAGLTSESEGVEPRRHVVVLPS